MVDVVLRRMQLNAVPCLRLLGWRAQAHASLVEISLAVGIYRLLKSFRLSVARRQSSQSNPFLLRNQKGFYHTGTPGFVTERFSIGTFLKYLLFTLINGI